MLCFYTSGGFMPDGAKRRAELSAENIKAINAVLAKDQRVELIPTRDGVKVIQIRREEVKGATSGS